jgi:hypothetical protein
MKSAAETIEACRALVRFVESRRWPLSDEKRLQEIFTVELSATGIVAEREVNLGDGDIIDFMAGDVGVEVKIKGTKRGIYRQCERYCLHDRVTALVLVSNVAMGMPASINCKPVFIASLGKGWL